MRYGMLKKFCTNVTVTRLRVCAPMTSIRGHFLLTFAETQLRKLSNDTLIAMVKLSG